MQESDSLRVPVRKDRWDTIDFWLLFINGLLVQGAFFLVAAVELIRGDSYVLWGWALLVVGAILFASGAVVTSLNIWKRFAEAYVVTATEFIHDCGYTQVRASLREISGLHPIKICRATTALKPALRIKFAHPIAGQWAIDVSPENPDGFLGELAARCPHLRRDGPRLRPSTGFQDVE